MVKAGSEVKGVIGRFVRDVFVFFTRVSRYLKLLWLQLINVLDCMIRDAISCTVTLVFNPIIQGVLLTLIVVLAIFFLLILIRNDGLSLTGKVLYIFTSTINAIISGVNSVLGAIASAINDVSSIVGSKHHFKLSVGSIDLTKACYADLLRAMPGVCSEYTDAFYLSTVAWNVAHPTTLCHLARFYQPSPLSGLIDFIAPSSIYDFPSCSLTRTASFCFYTSVPYLGFDSTEAMLIIVFLGLFRGFIFNIFLIVVLIILDIEYLFFKTPTTLMFYITLSSTRVSLLSPFNLKQREYLDLLPVKNKASE